MKVLFRTAIEIVEVVQECFSQALVHGNSKNTKNNQKGSAIARAHCPLRVATPQAVDELNNRPNTML